MAAHPAFHAGNTGSNPVGDAKETALYPLHQNNRRRNDYLAQAGN